MVKENIKVSVIMPVYNAAAYLEETIISVFGAGFSDVELIAVDDGSSDNSLEILQKYQEKYNHFIVLQQENAGPSAARNHGLKYASGEFVYFLDSDDLLETAVLREMCDKANKSSADMVIANYDIFNEFRTFGVPSIKKLVKKDIIAWDDLAILWTFSLCNKLFRREKIEALNLRFPKTNYSEDGVFVMCYTYHASKIIGHDDIVFHYRRMTSAENKSITSAVSTQKVKDYLLSHEMIYDLICQKLLDVNPHHKSINELIENELSANVYVNEFLKKEITILFNQFYKLFWALDEDLIKLIVENIEKLLAKVNLRIYYTIAEAMPELIIKKLPSSYAMAKEMAKITVLLYGTPEEKDAFVRCLFSLSVQRFIPYKILIPQGMKDVVENEIELRNQIIYVDCETESEFYNKAIHEIHSEYTMIADTAFIYEKTALNEMYKLVANSQVDFLTATIYIASEEKAFASSFHGRTLLSVKNYRNGKKTAKHDCLLGNKIIRSQLVKKIYEEGETIQSIIQGIYRKEYFNVTEKCYVIFSGGDETDLWNHIYNQNVEIEPDDLRNISLGDSRFQTNEIEVYQKIRTSKLKSNQWKREIIYKLTRLPVKNRTLIFSVRRDDELDDNLQSIVDKIEGEKIIISKRLPHDSIFKLKMYYYIATSRVIITDDYVRYLRLFPLKKEQRVIQLWHACGAFKKFGLQGTTLSLGLERATHIQYNLVSVSAENIRQIYANAFDIDVSNVAALGVPRTDLFFDNVRIEEKKRMIYQKYPEWQGKEIILYSPTFRDKTGDRTRFEPELNFEKLSKSLNSNQIFLVAPHPVMKSAIVHGKYDNVYEVRDIHTLDLMFVSDILITDYSSVIFEYSLLKKPMVFFCYDLELYDRGFYLSYNELPGEMAKNEDELINCITGPERLTLKNSYDTFVEKYMGACDGKSSERIADLVNKYVGGKR